MLSHLFRNGAFRPSVSTTSRGSLFSKAPATLDAHVRDDSDVHSCFKSALKTRCGMGVHVLNTADDIF